MTFYRWILSVTIIPLLKRFFFRGTDWKEFQIYSKFSQAGTLWFHGASAGEIETLTPVVERALTGSEFQIIVSTFSFSGVGYLKRLKKWAEENNCAHKITVGLSPWEGEWKKALLEVKPLLFVTSKYEAWPELWVSLVELKIPLEIISARNRTSLKLAQKMCQWVKGEIPDLYLDADEDSVMGLLQFVGQERIQITPDSRWDRVIDRKKRSSQRAKDLLDGLINSRREYSVLGSFWVDDFHLLEKYNFKQASELLCVVPHDVNSENVSEIKQRFEKLGARVFTSKGKTKEVIANESREMGVLIVDEVGVLLDLYARAKWVYVGGGFSKGVHSTIEPAIALVPIACGTKRMGEFSEIGYLQKTGQLSIVKSGDEFQNWLTQLGNVIQVDKDHWNQQNQTKLGASDKVWKKLKTILEVNKC